MGEMTLKVNGECTRSSTFSLRICTNTYDRAGWLLQYLGIVVTKANRLEEGLAYFLRAHTIFLAIGGQNDLDTAHTGYQVARHLFKDGDYPSSL